MVRHGGLAAALVYAAVACLFGLTMIFVGVAIGQTHAAGAAGFWIVPGLAVAALAPFVAHARRWAMVAAVLVPGALALLYLYHAPEHWQVALPVPAVFALLAVAAFLLGAGSAPQSVPHGAGVAAEVFAAAAFLGGLVAVLLLPVPAEPGGRAIGVDVPVLGLVFAGLSVLVWRGSRWAMIALVVLALALAFLAGRHDFALRRAIGMAYPALFGVLAMAALAAGAHRAGVAWSAYRVAAEVYAALVYLYAVVTAFLAPTLGAGHPGFLAPRGMSLYGFATGVAFAALAPFIWRGRRWAMLAAFALALAQWLALAALAPSFWRDAAHWSAPALAALLTAICILTGRAGPDAAGGKSS
jgi:hypothetical protein